MTTEHAGYSTAVEPYFSCSSSVVYLGDCREILPSLTTRVQAVITDPPFFMPAVHYQARTHWQRTWSDTSILSTFWGSMLDLLLPVTLRSGHVLVFCNADSYPVFYPEMYRRFDHLACLIWDKKNLGLGRVWRHRHEMIIASRWQTSKFSETGGSRSDILECKAVHASRREHPVEKPIELLSQLIEPTTHIGDTVLDPFSGGGSTALAAVALGRRAIAIEKEERYAEIIAKRLSSFEQRVSGST